MQSLLITANGFASNGAQTFLPMQLQLVALNGKQLMLFEDRYYQTEAQQSIFDYFDGGGRGNPLIAMPTGTGKSVVIANFIKLVFKLYPNQRILMLTHVKKLISQNAEKLMQVWPTAPLGINSAGLGQRDLVMPIIFGGVATVKNVIEKLGAFDLLVIDEAHLLSDKEDTMYQYIIAYLLKANPFLKVIGFTATPYRMKQGLLTEGGIFTDIIYDITTRENFNRLIAEGFISPPIAKPTQTKIDISNVGVQNGEFKSGELEAAFDQDEITYAAVQESIEYGYNRCSWLTFATGVKHAEHVASMFNSFGIATAAVHSKLSEKENDARIEDHKNGILRNIVNMGMLTTGYDHPPIDFIPMLRATLSPGLWVQMIGRGTRPCAATRKENCLVLDFARNTPRLGPINDPIKPRKPGKGGGGDAPIRICDACGFYNHASARFCCNCKTEFAFEMKIFKQSGNDELLTSDAPQIQYFNVQKVIYNLHEKRDRLGNLISAPMIKVSYFCGYQMFSEYVCLQHVGLPRKKARDWWRQRHREEPPETTQEALYRTVELRVPAKIRVWVNKKYPEVLSCEY